jgi:glycosyltransferase involved in cell wall biosynthesis
MVDRATVHPWLDIALYLFGGGLGGVGHGAYEAAISGNPLVATLPDPAHRGLLSGVTARLLAPCDKQGILQVLRLLVANSEAREKLGASARAAIRNRHAPELIAHATFELYKELVSSTKEL